MGRLIDAPVAGLPVVPYLWRGRPELGRLNAEIMASRPADWDSKPGPRVESFDWRTGWRPSVSRGDAGRRVS